MEDICSRCHAQVAQYAGLTRCPACGGELLPRPSLLDLEQEGPPPESDRRGIVLPRRHALGGIITPQ